MGSPLGSIFGYIDALKRKAADVASDPVEYGRQLDYNAGQKLDLLEQSYQGSKGPTFSPSQMTPDAQQANQQLTDEIASNVNPAGITVWQGSPYLFNKFDPRKAGTGMGQQNYGHGAYLAGPEAVGDRYRRMITGTRLREKFDAWGASNPKIPDDEIVRRVMADPSVPTNQKYLIDAVRQQGRLGFGSTRKAVSNLLSHPENYALDPQTRAALNQFGYLYKVDLPDEHVANMLDWDKLLTKQEPAFKKLVSASNDPGNQQIRRSLDLMDEGSAGGDFVRSLVGVTPSQRALSNEMYEAGIPGNVYSDPNTRHQTSNYVVFPGAQKDLKILERNGMAIDALRVFGR